MLNKLSNFVRQHEMLVPGDHLVCAVSGGADSVALLFAMYLLAPKLQITLEAAHFNHGLRGEESDEDALFVRNLCDRLDIGLHMGQGSVVAGKKGLEAAARSARYAFLERLSGKIATAHTADDNAETVLMHMVRGSGLKGLGGIAPVRGNLIRPMLTVTRQEVLAFLREYNLSWREDSTNRQDMFLRNRLRHRVMPVLAEENPSLAPNLSQMALRLREDERVLSQLAAQLEPVVSNLRQQPYALRSRWIAAFLEGNGVKEPEKEHIELVDRLIYSDKPSAKADLPGGIVVSRNYDRLEVASVKTAISTQLLQCPCSVPITGTEYVLEITEADSLQNAADRFTVQPMGNMYLRSRKPGDYMRVSGGTKSLKKLFIDKKIPAMQRNSIPVICDDCGILGVMGIGPDMDRLAADLPALEIRFKKI